MSQKIWITGLILFTFLGVAAEEASDNGISTSDEFLVGEELPLEFSDIVTAMGAVQSLHLAIEEIREYTIREVPLALTGNIHFLKGNRLRVEYVTPEKHSFTLDLNSDTVIQQLGSLLKTPIVLGGKDEMIQFLTDFLNGDIPKIQKRFDVFFEKENEAWEITFAPNNGFLKRRLRGIRVTGKKLDLELISLFFKNGNTNQIIIKEQHRSFRKNTLDLEKSS